MTKPLLLIPTEMERQWAREQIAVMASEFVVELCGFGPVVAGVRTAQLIARYRPPHVLLLGIAGAIDGQLEIGSAYEFDQVACYGIGAGCGSRFQSASALGWKQWAGGLENDISHSIADKIPLALPASSPIAPSRQLLTVCAAAATASEVDHHRQQYPYAVAEDMEGFAVAVACRLSQVPLRIIRGMSNLAGDRDHRNWRSSQAMGAAAQLAWRSFSP